MKIRLLLATLITAFSLDSSAQQPLLKLSQPNEQAPIKKSSLRVMLDYEKTKDPSTGDIPKQKLLKAKDDAKKVKKAKKSVGTVSRIEYSATLAPAVSLAWTERGPYADAVGSSNGNTRANSAITAGRVRAIWPDLADATGKTVWAAGVDGGLWKTTDITASTANWVAVSDDQFDNLAITSIAQDPTNTSVLYAATGESFMGLAGGRPSTNAVKGVGVYKSINNGLSWTLLSSTTGGAFDYCTKIICGSNGYVYLATRMVVSSSNTISHLGALRRSADGGVSWTDITPSSTYMPNPSYQGYSAGQIGAISDIEISSTGRMHIVSGMMGYPQYYTYTINPATVSSSSGWVNAANPFPNYTTSTDYIHRTELAVKGDTLYSLPVKNSTLNADVIYKSTDGGANWAATPGQISGLTNGQAYYDLAVAINPVNAKECIIGGLDTWRTTDGGISWTKISNWYGTSGQYLHADQHNIVWYNGGNKLLFSNDGGVFYSADKGTTIRDRNSGLNIKQFYSTAIHPSSTNYFLAGAQDNGTHQLNGAGLASSIEILGGDGGFVAIDQTDPQYQFGAYVYGGFRRSVDGGNNWSYLNFYEGPSTSASQMGQFINAYALDDSSETIYAGASAGSFFRWSTATTTSPGTYYMGSSPPTGAAIVTGVTAFGGGQVSAVKVSPHTLNRVFFGTTNGKIVRIDNAHTATSNPTTSNITPSAMLNVSGYVSSINIGSTDNNVITCYSNYGVSSVWVSSDGGTNWNTIDGNLADIPVRWAMFYPGDDTRAIIATETGVWITDLINGVNTIWTTDASFPTVRTDMLAYRKLDRTLVAATHGRGLWSAQLPDLNCTPIAPANITVASVIDTCGGRIYRYTAPALTGSATGWAWSFVGTLGINAVVDSGSLTSRIVRMKYSLNTAAATGDSVRVAYTSDCGNSLLRSSKLTNTLLTAPLAPLNITITSVRDTCGGRIYRYTAPALSGIASGWVWSFSNTTLGNTASVDSGSLTSRIVRIKFTINNAAVDGDSVRVAYTSGCGNSLLRSSKLTNTLLTAPAIAPLSITIRSVIDTCGGRIYRYTAPALAGSATGWAWSFVGTLGSTALVDSGSLTSQTLRVKFLSNAAAVTGDSVRLAYSSGCGNGSRLALKLTNTLLSAPSSPASITTSLVSNICGQRVYRYAAPALSGSANGWQWSFVGTLGANATIDSGSLNSRIIKMKYALNSAAAIGDSVRVAYTSGCGTSLRRAAILSNLAFAGPIAPAAITTTLVSDVCGARIYRYTAPALVSGATGWQWSFVGTLGNNASLDSGSLNSQVVKMKYTINTGAALGDSARVKYTSDCANSANKSASLTNISKVPAAPASITITSVRDTCGGRIYRYTAPALTGIATGWVWSFSNTTLGNTASLDSGSLTSRIVRIKFTSNSAAVAGDSVRVAYSSGCGNSPLRSLKLTNTLLTAPTTAPLSITIASVRDTCGGRIYRYTAPALSGTATGYMWSFVGPIGSNALLDSGSLTSRIIRMKFVSNAAAGTDSAKVLYTSGCGNSPIRALKLTNTLLAAPVTAPVAPTIVLVSTTNCKRVYRYSTTSTLTGTATGYLWSFVGSLGSTATLDSGTLNSRVVRMAFTNTSAATTDSARVVFKSGCGNSPVAKTKLTNTLLNCTPVVIASAMNKTSANIEVSSFNVKVYPNPSMGVFNVQVQSPVKESIGMRIVDAQGRLIEVLKANPYTNTLIGRDLRPGIYFLEVIQGNNKKVLKLMKE